MQAAKACIEQAKEISNAVCNAEGDQLFQTVKRVDTISDLLCSVLDAAELLRNVHPDQDFVYAANEACTLLHGFMHQLNTNPELYLALKRVYNDSLLKSKMSDQESKVAMLLLQDFEKSGVHMPLKTRQRFVELNNEILELGQEFSMNAYPDIKYLQFRLPELNGAPKQLLNYLSKNSPSEQIQVPIHSDIASLLLSTVHNENVRKSIFMALNSASENQISTLEKLLKSRGSLARVLDHESYAHMYLIDKMAKSPEVVNEFLSTLANSNMIAADKELQKLQDVKKATVGSSQIMPWDRFYYSRFMHTPGHNDSNSSTQLLNYFSIGNVFQGLSDLFRSLYGVTLEVQDTVPGEIWHPEVRKLSVVHESEGLLGTIYCDLFQRDVNEPRKYENAAHFTVRCCRRIDNDEQFITEKNWRMHNKDHEKVVVGQDGKTRTYQLPIVVLVTSFSRPGSQIPSLLDLNEIETLFHEMGHAMHSMFAQTDFQHISGTRVAMDFVEVPSILTENFAKTPSILASFGHHWKTNEKVPLEMIVQRQSKMKTLQALEDQNQLQMAMLDQQYHSSLVFEPNFSSSEVLYKLSNSMNPIPMPRPTAWQIQFTHLFTYGSSYYSYAWSRKWANKIHDRYFINSRNEDWRIGGEAFRKELLSCGGGRDPWSGLKALGVL